MGKMLILLLIILFTSCISFYRHPVDGTLRPKKPKFSLAKKDFECSKFIDTTAIYVDIDTFKFDIYRSVFYLKFYNNGRLFKSAKDVPFSFTEYNFKPGFIGYYFSNNDKLQIEYYSVNPSNKYKTEYTRQKGFIKGDTIFLEKEFIKGEKNIYVKQKLNFVPKPSNW